jgi:hypothetical protein
MADEPGAVDAGRLALLEAEVAELRRALAADATSRKWVRVRGPWRLRALVAATVALAAAVLSGAALASTPGHPADVTFIPLSVPHKILSGASIAKGATNSVVVNGAATTVPTDATSVQLTVAVKSTAAGSLSVFPTDNPGSSSADTIAFPAGNVLVSAVSKQSPGLASKVSFKNNGTATATVTVTITGYSTQTTASNVSGSGGTAGQVLTDTGNGAAWQNLPPADAAHFSGAGGAAGQVLTNTGSGATWSPATRAYGTANNFTSNALSNSAYHTVASVTVPAGAYHVTFNATLSGSSASQDYTGCYLNTPTTTASEVFGSTSSANSQNIISMQSLVNLSSGGTVGVQCIDSLGAATVYYPTLVAISVGSVTGAAPDLAHPKVVTRAARPTN